MGFLDKAKAMAEQAQAKLDEVQQDFNAKQASGAAGSEDAAVEYDQHGRRVTREESVGPPAPPPVTLPPSPRVPAGFEPEAPGPPVVADVPAAPAATVPPVPAPPAPGPVASPPAPAPAAGPPAPAGGAPDLRTDIAPPPITSGDPLAG
jgi:hypothetical protein